MVSSTHEQNNTCSPKKLNNTAHEHTIICRQLFAGHVVGSQPMNRKKHLHRLDKLNDRALRYIYSDRSSTYAGESTEGTSYTLADRRIQDMLILVFKAVNNLLPTYLSDLFIIRENIKNLRGTNKLVIPNVSTTRYGTKSVAFTAPKAWNSLPDRLRSMKSLKDFKIAVRSM